MAISVILSVNAFPPVVSISIIAYNSGNEIAYDDCFEYALSYIKKANHATFKKIEGKFN